MKAEVRAMRFARHLLDEYRNLGSFEVDPMDVDEAKQLMDAFQDLGCKVEQSPHSTRIVVTVTTSVDE